MVGGEKDIDKNQRLVTQELYYYSNYKVGNCGVEDCVISKINHCIAFIQFFIHDYFFVLPLRSKVGNDQGNFCEWEKISKSIKYYLIII